MGPLLSATCAILSVSVIGFVIVRKCRKMGKTRDDIQAANTEEESSSIPLETSEDFVRHRKNATGGRTMASNDDQPTSAEPQPDEDIRDSNSNVCKTVRASSGSSEVTSIEDGDTTDEETFLSAESAGMASREGTPCDVSDEGLGSSQGNNDSTDDTGADVLEHSELFSNEVQHQESCTDQTTALPNGVPSNKPTESNRSREDIRVSEQWIEETKVTEDCLHVLQSQCDIVQETVDKVSADCALEASVTVTSDSNDQGNTEVDSEPVDYEVEYQGIINEEESCVENLDIVQGDIQQDGLQGYNEDEIVENEMPLAGGSEEEGTGLDSDVTTPGLAGSGRLLGSEVSVKAHDDPDESSDSSSKTIDEDTSSSGTENDHFSDHSDSESHIKVKGVSEEYVENVKQETQEADSVESHVDECDKREALCDNGEDVVVEAGCDVAVEAGCDVGDDDKNTVTDTRHTDIEVDTESKVTTGVSQSGPSNHHLQTDNNKQVINTDKIDTNPVLSTQKTLGSLDAIAEKNASEIGSKNTESGGEDSDEEDTWRSCVLCFKDKMDSLGLKSASLETFVTSSTITLNTMCTNHKRIRLRRQNTDPGTQYDTEKENRAIKIVKMASFDSSDVHQNGLDTSDTGMESMIIKESFNESVHYDKVDDNNKLDDDDKLDDIDKIYDSEKVKDDKSDSSTNEEYDRSNSQTNTTDNAMTGTKSHDVRGMMTDVTDKSPIPAIDVATVAMLRDFGEKLVLEQKQRERAEDWAEFLTLELDAQIGARTTAEERHVAIRDRMIRLAGKYRKLKTEYKVLVAQIHDIAVEDQPKQNSTERPKSSLLRRNRSQTDRNALLVKRNAMLIRGSNRKSSSDSDSSPESSPGVQNGEARNMSDVKQKWETNYKERQDGITHVTSSPDVSMTSQGNVSADLSELLPQPSDQDKFQKEMAAYDKYTTSTPIKPSESVGHLNVLSQPSEMAKNKFKSAPDVRVAKEEDNTVSVKAFTNMWEKKIQKLPFEVKVSTQHVEVPCDEPDHRVSPSPSPTPKRMRIRNIEDFQKKVEATVRQEHKQTGKHGRESFTSSNASSDDEFFDVGDETPEGDAAQSDVLTTSINAKEALHMFENFSVSNTSSDASMSRSANQLNLSPTGSVNVIAEAVTSEEGNPGNPPEIPVERSNQFSSLKSQWEQKGRATQNNQR